MPIVSRIAPTPSGFLHVGNVFNFIMTWLEVRSRRGTLHLRIDDIDKPRERREFVDNIFETLHWLELDYDHGPVDTDDFYAHYSQSLRQGHYMSAAQKLTELGYTYSCCCSRKAIAQNAINGQYAGTCRTLGLPHDERFALRIDTSKAQHLRINGTEPPELLDDLMRDFIIRRSDGLFAYQLASVVDDHLLGCNLIVRGQDLWASSLAQVYLASLLGYHSFVDAHFIHHPLLVNGQMGKLSKSQDAAAVRQQFPNKGDLFASAGMWLGLGEGHSSLLSLLEAYKV